MIEVRDLFRIFATEEVGAAALQGLTLSVAEREVVVVLGPSGSGKTTFLRMLAGLDRPSAGSVRVFGLDLGTLSGRRLADYRARETGYAEQHYTRSLAPELTAQELVGLRLASPVSRGPSACAGPTSCSSGSVWSRSDSLGRTSSPGVSNSESPCARRSHTGRGSSSPMSRRASSIMRTRPSSTE